MTKIWKNTWIVCVLAALLTMHCAAVVPTEVIPGGAAIGLDLQTDGLYVTGFSQTPQSGAERAGIEIGDRIIRINGQEIREATELSEIVNRGNGSRVTLSILRDSESLDFSVQPQQSDGVWRLGLMVKDSIAGVGTLTYYDPASGRYGALGHAVNDANGTPVPLQQGVVVPVEIVEVNPGKQGVPGALVGVYQVSDPLGTVTDNLAEGVFGKLYAAPENGELYPIAAVDEVRRGPATIRCTVSDSTVEEYTVEITSFRADDANLRNIQLRVTDPRLIEATGGIVQGISGAPILQDGKLVGAVTHVLVDRPERGYGIYIGNMLDAADAQAMAA